MTYIPSITLNNNSINADPSGALRTSSSTNFIDGKTLNADNTLAIQTVTGGAGTNTFLNNMNNMTVAGGTDYVIRKSKRCCPYLSKKSIYCEFTFDNFHVQTNVTKAVGLFSSNTVAPYASNHDGAYLYNDGTTIRLRVSNNGTLKLDLPWTSWDNYSQISSYDWQNFTVCMIDFLWLGGAVLRLFLKVGNSFVLCHTFDYAGTAQGPFMLTPVHPLRAEIRSTGGAGSFRFICAAVGVDTFFTEITQKISLNSGATPINFASTASTYVLLAARKNSSFGLNTVVDVIDINLIVNSADTVKWSIQLNPTISGALTYNVAPNFSAVEYAVGTGAQTVTTEGVLLDSGYDAQNLAFQTDPTSLNNNLLASIGSTLQGVSDVVALCVQPVTANAQLLGSLGLRQLS